MGAAFTQPYNGVSNKLRSAITIKGNGVEIEEIALWDTGATNSAISNEVARKLGVPATGFIRVQTPSGESTRKTYKVDVVLPNGVAVDGLEVADSEIGAQGIGMLVGMDVINRGDFTVSTYKGKTTFSFRIPSEGVTDYVKQIRTSNAIGKIHGSGKRKRNHKK